MQDILKKIGLSEKQVTVYLSLLRLGLTNAQHVAKDADLPRQTVYSLLAPLIQEGLVEQSDKRGVRQYFADPNRLISLIEERSEDLKRQKKSLEEELPKFLADNKRGIEFPVVQYFEGREGLKHLFGNILDMYKKGKQKMFRGYGINFFYPGLEDFLQNFVEERHKYDVETNLFIAEGSDGFGISGETTLGRKIKRLDIEPQQAGVYLVGNRVFLFSYKDNVGVMIENGAITQFLKDAFDDHWKRVK